MLPIRTILYPTDCSEHAGRLFRLACSLARDYQARMIVLHVAPPPLGVWVEGAFIAPLQTNHAALRQQLQHYQSPDPSVPVEHRLEEGAPIDVILRTAREEPCDVIVMGTHGRSGFNRLVMGSVTERVIREAPCAVVTVKVPAAATQPNSAGYAPETEEIRAPAPVCR